jgi:translation elongation factor EF-1alpha
MLAKVSALVLGTKERINVIWQTQGVNKLVVVINKMDDPTVQWAKPRYDECIGKITPYLKGIGYHPKNDLFFMPVSAQTLTGSTFMTYFALRLNL